MSPLNFPTQHGSTPALLHPFSRNRSVLPLPSSLPTEDIRLFRLLQGHVFGCCNCELTVIPFNPVRATFLVLLALSRGRLLAATPLAGSMWPLLCAREI